MTSPIPPLLRKRQTRKARAEKIPAPKESQLHFAVKKRLDEYLRPEWIYTHPPLGEVRDAEVGGKLKRMGTKPGWSDFILIAPGGRMHALELKRAGNRLSPAQRQFQDDCLRLGVPHAVVFDEHQALDALASWGALRIKIVNGVPALGEEQ